MKKRNQIIALFLALCMVFALAACGDKASNDPEPSKDPGTDVSEPVDAEPEAPSIAGTYRFDYTDPYGDVTSFTVTLKDSGSFNILTTGAMGNGVYNGTEWTDNGDGTFTTGATDSALKVEWAAEDGSASWTIDGDTAAPVGYTVPTEFLTKSEISDPASAMECVGVYTFAEFNAERGSTTPWVLWINADGTYRFWRDNSFLGLRGFSGTWTYAGDNVVDLSAAVFDEEGKDPVASFFTDDWASSWTLYGDGSAIPMGWDAAAPAVDLSSISDAALYPDGAEYVGIYTFAEFNAERGSTTPWVIWVNADGTYRFWRDNSFLGLRGFSGTWTYAGDGVFDFSAAAFDEEGKDPVASFFTDDWASTWTFHADGSAVPAGWDATIPAVDLSSISDTSLILK